MEKYIIENALVKNGESVLVGVSGGADSVALIFSLKELSQKMGFNLYAAHYLPFRNMVPNRYRRPFCP